MNIRVIIAALLLSVAQALPARTAVDFFLEAPDGIVPLLGRNARMDMADYHRYGLATATENEVGGQSRIVESSDRAMLIEMGPSSSVQLAVLPVRNDTLVAVVETVLTPQADSGIRFYRVSDWSEVQQRTPAVSISDFYMSGDAPDHDIPIFFVSAAYDPGKDAFVFTNTTGGYYTDDERPEKMSGMALTVVRRFDGRRWKTVKD